MTSDRTVTRRTAVVRLLGAVGSFAISTTPSCALSEGPPPFGTIRHQFIEVRGARPVPPIAIPRLSGGALDLTSLKGKVVLVNFWATWCAACRTELPLLDRLTASGGDDLAVIAIATDRNRSRIAPFVKDLNLRHLMIGIDPGGLVGHAGATDEIDTPFALYSMPISFLLGVTGQVEGYISGEADWLSVEARRLLDYYANASHR